jgi:hypothetical protein
MSKRLVLCRSVEEADAAYAVGILLYFSSNTLKWTPDDMPYRPSAEDEDVANEWITRSIWGYYVEDDDDE